MGKDKGSYEGMSEGKPKVYEESEVAYHDEPAENAFEKAKWNSNGFDQSGMK